MIDGLVCGRLHGAPVERASRNGNRFVTAKVRAGVRDGEALFVNIIAFSTTVIDALLALGDGESVALAGELTPKAFTDRSGDPRPSLDLLAHAVLSAYDVKRRRKASRANASTESSANDGAPFDDEIP